MEAENAKRGRSSVARNAGIVSLAVMASRVLGLVRDQVFAIFFGAGLYYDAFLTAFRIPNLLRDLFAEGALSAAFVTTFSQVLATKGEQEAIRLSNRVATLMILVITSISLVGWWHAPAIVHMLAPGFYDVPGKAELTIKLTRIMIPFLLLVALAAQAMGILNARGHFGIPALASAFFNVGSIVGGLLLGFVIGPAIGLSTIEGMAYGTLIGGFLQFAVQWPSLARAGFSYRPMISISDPGVRQIFSLMGPAIIGTAAVQVNVFVNTNFASSIIDPATGAVANGPVSWLSYAFRFMQFPIGVFGVAIATAALPPLSRSSAQTDYNEFRRTLAHSLALVFLLCVPSAVGLAVLGRPIVALIFEHGTIYRFRHGADGRCVGGLFHRSRRLCRRQGSFAGLLRSGRCSHSDADQSRFHRRQLCDESFAGGTLRPRRPGVFHLDCGAGQFYFACAFHAPPDRPARRKSPRNYAGADLRCVDSDGGRRMVGE